MPTIRPLGTQIVSESTTRPEPRGGRSERNPFYELVDFWGRFGQRLPVYGSFP